MRDISEAVDASETGSRGIEETAVKFEGESAVPRACRDLGGQRIAVKIGVIAQDARGRDEQGCVLVGRQGVGDGERRPIRNTIQVELARVRKSRWVKEVGPGEKLRTAVPVLIINDGDL